MRDEHGKMYDYGSGENGGMVRPSNLEPARNVLQTNSLNANNTFADVMTLNGYVDITPIEGLKVTLNGTVTETTNGRTRKPYSRSTATP